MRHGRKMDGIDHFIASVLWAVVLFVVVLVFVSEGRCDPKPKVESMISAIVG